jgi:hypothetical protein
MTQQTISRAHARRSLVASALLCFAAAIVLTPGGVRSQLAVRQLEIAEAPPHVEPPLTAIAPAGDAFAPRANLDEELHPALPATPRLLLPQLPRTPQIGLRIPVVQPPRLRVTAIATGSHPSAIVDDGGTARVFSLGDPLAGSSISAISDDGIRLTNGRHLSLDPGVPTP